MCFEIMTETAVWWGGGHSILFLVSCLEGGSSPLPRTEL